MPSEDNSRKSPITPKDGLYFNGFVDHEPTVTANSSFMIPGQWQQESTPRKRRARRGSDSTPGTSSRNEHMPRKPLGHSRSHTESPSTSSHVHPLGGSTAGHSRSEGASGITRPHLSRIMSAWESPAGSDVGSRSDVGSVYDETPAQEVEEKTVLVHEVLSKDSLAGVALKYGITMSELRKANQLWASDSIHLRKVLYIPLDAANRSRSKPLVDISTTSGSSQDGLHQDESQSSTIRRIPASKLSFFPPASKSTILPNSDDLFNSQYGYTTTTMPSRRSNDSPAHHSRALSSILTAFPLAASTRDTIIARLSFDSERSSTSDEQEHELDDVRASMMTARPRLRSSTSRGDMTNTAKSGSPTRSRSKRSSKSRHSTSPPASQRTPIDSRKSWTHTDTINPSTAVRTIQLEPSPAMRVPSVTMKPKSRHVARSGSVDELGGRR